MKYCESIYLDHAATSYPKPRAVIEAAIRACEEEGGNAGRSAHTLSLRAAERIWSARETVADFFGLPDSRGVIFTKNATEALNLGVATLAHKGGHVLCDNMAHNALLRPLYTLEAEGKIHLSLYSASSNAEDISKQIKDDTILICATHASNICGARADACALGYLAKERGIAYLLDASQSAGHIPICANDIGADVICLPAHKGLLGIMGAGAALFLHPDAEYPAFLSGGSGAYSRSKKMPRELPEHFEAGTLPLPAIAALEAGVKQIQTIGLAEIGERIRRLEDLLLEGLCTMHGITVHGESGNGILSFTHQSILPERLAALLDDNGIAVRAGLHCAPIAHDTLGTPKSGTVRISLGYTNKEEECERFLSVLHKILKK